MRPRTYQATVVITTLICVTSILIVVRSSYALFAHQSSYIVSEGMWPVVEQERLLLLLADRVRQISLGASITEEDYQLRRTLAFSRVEIVREFAENNQTFNSYNQRDLLDSLRRTVDAFGDIEQNKLPSPSVARQLVPLVDEAVGIAHDLVNIRRDEVFAANIVMSRLIRQLQVSQVVSIVSLVLGGLWFWRVIHQSAIKDIEIAQLQAKAVKDRNLQLQANAEQAEELARTKERTRLAREIHDGLGHHISIIHAKLGSAVAILDVDREKSKAILEQVEYLTQQALDDIRQSVNALRTLPNDQPSLVEAFMHLTEECTDANVPTRLRICGTPRVLAAEVEQTLYRVAQEALTNVRKHSKAHQVDVMIEYGPNNMVSLIIEDDGKGAWIREDGLGVVGKGGYGLQGMCERIEKLEGNIRFSSSVNEGFTVEVEVVA